MTCRSVRMRYCEVSEEEVEMRSDAASGLEFCPLDETGEQNNVGERIVRELV